MAVQDQIRALVPRDAVPVVLEELERDFGIGSTHVEVSEPEPGDYRDEAPELELRTIVRAGWWWMVGGAIAGAVIGGLSALLSPTLRDIAIVSVPLLAFGGAWAAMAVGSARGVQLARREDDRGDEVHHVDERDRSALRLMTIRGVRDRAPAEDLLTARGATLLDTRYPQVGDDAPGARPAQPGEDRAGPPAS